MVSVMMRCVSLSNISIHEINLCEEFCLSAGLRLGLYQKHLAVLVCGPLALTQTMQGLCLKHRIMEGH